MAISLLIVEDELKFAELLRSLFGSCREFSNVELVRDAEAALTVLGQKNYDVILTDFRLPGADGLELMGKAKEAGASPKFVVMTSFDADHVLLESYALGAFAYLPKTSKPESFLRSVLNAASGRKSIAENVAQRVIDNSIGSLTVQSDLRKIRHLKAPEKQVLCLALAGNSNSEIARTLHYAESTVKEKMTLLFERFNVASRGQLLARLRGVPHEVLSTKYLNNESPS